MKKLFTSILTGAFAVSLIIGDFSVKTPFFNYQNIETAHAAFDQKFGQFTLNTTTGNQSVTGLGFQPKIVLFFSSADTADGGTNTGTTMFGAADGTNQWVTETGGMWGFGAGGWDYSNWKTDRILYFSVGFGVTVDADFVSLDADGFTIDVNIAGGSAAVVHYLALGGSDLSAKVGNFTLNSSTGNQSVTGVGFLPEFVFFSNSKSGTGTTEEAYGMISFGGSVSSTEEFTVAIDGSGGNTNPTEENGSLITTKSLRRQSAGAVSWEADFISNDSDGFTIDITTASGSPAIGYFALTGLTYKIGTATQKTTTGAQATTGVGFQPEAILFFGDGKATSTSISAHSGISVGGATSSTARGFIASQGQDAVASNTKYQSYNHVSHAFGSITATSSSNNPTLTGRADFTSFDADGFTLNWGTTDGTAREFVYVAFGQDAGGGSPSEFMISISDGE